MILLKLYVIPSLYRQGKFERVSIYENDILLLMLNYKMETESLIKLLSEYLLESDLDEIKEILTDIEAKIKRFASKKEFLQDNEL
ncbi:hypothetical protein [Cyanobacterium sp. Dongsha4]|uniref:hypothetical protein n=1 Tax=Cyanobacterium sp. DS4 TaxID=2878255 RepID=UPI002E812F3F|nr:hypothetical protein [Cyanobacterium sp. Dongsha4]WVL02237.1 hypothetical protein Dongsha4_08615 [Cyanobacterium sp. Dongsha4]